MTASTRIVSASPHIKQGDSTPTIMWSVVASLVPVVASAIYFFGPSAILVLAASTAGALAPESLLGGRGARSLRDGSAAITGILLGLTLPPGIPLWMAFLGGAFGIGFGKLVFGGLGQNVFNPALLGRAFLQAAFPVAITTWPIRAESWWNLRGDNFALPLMSPSVPEAMTGATPLGLMKFEQMTTPSWDLMLGTTGGSLGETSGLIILICGLYLAARRHLDWRIPASILGSVALFSTLLHGLDAARYPGPVFMLFSGGLMLGAVYMATDMVTSPVTHRGCWIFGAGIGFLVLVIRLWGGLSEGVMYAILLMNALVPFINRATQPRIFGTLGVGGES
ncbi:MAG: RnfABCDGE type electron transport complex subunit D [Deltaproteobacteria bacterium]|nr:RnfABCDGE type electron transport complex subunit D [Deltaproteobacteria bacterium]MBW2698067.1 RnfABCDGE type electron transport complex subunit D [Deltaproteobacteria bacterium]